MPPGATCLSIKGAYVARLGSGFSICPLVFNLFVRCFLILFGGRFGRVSCGTLPILATIHAELVELQRVLLLFKTFLLFFD